MNSTAKAGKSALGLTMVELAVVLVIMGLIGTVFYGTFTRFVGKLKQDEAKEQVLTAREKIRGFARTGDRELPEPEIDGGESVLPASVGQIRDPWGERYHYYLADELTNSTVQAENATTFDIEFYDEADEVETPTGPPLRTVSNVAYAVVSKGPNQQQEYEPPESPMRVLERDGQARRGDGVEYDDILQFVTLPELKASVFDGAQQEDSGPPPDYAYRLDDEEGDIEADGGVMQGNAATGTVPGFPGITALDLTDNANSEGSYLDLSAHPANDTSTYDYTTYTIMGWYKTDDNTIDDFAPITSRQSSGGSSNERNWWVTLWANGFTGQGGGKTPGELALKAQSTAGGGDGNAFFADSNYPSSPAHHDAEWHFFAARMSFDGANYVPEVFVSDQRPPLTEETLQLGAASISQTSPPRTNATYDLYIGYNPTGTRYFRGYIDDVIIYDRALTDDEITTYFDNSKGDHGY